PTFYRELPVVKPRQGLPVYRGVVRNVRCFSAPPIPGSERNSKHQRSLESAGLKNRFGCIGVLYTGNPWRGVDPAPKDALPLKIPENHRGRAEICSRARHRRGSGVEKRRAGKSK